MSVRHTSTELNWGHHAAAEAGDIEGVVEFLAKDPKQISDYDIDGQTMLHFAAKNGHVELARYLIEQGPGFVNFKNIRYRTPLYWATYKAGEVEGCEEIAIMLVRAGADPSIKSKDEVPYIDLSLPISFLTDICNLYPHNVIIINTAIL